jgi:hypothetical protein
MKSLQMLPRRSRNDITHRWLLYPVFFCQNVNTRSIRVSFSNFSNLIGCEFGGRSALPDSRSPFCHHVSGVPSRARSKQMSRIAARRVVAVVTNTHALGDRAIHQLGRNPVRAKESHDTILSEPKLSVPLRVNRHQPWPAGVRAAAVVNVAPEFLSLFGCKLMKHGDLQSLCRGAGCLRSAAPSCWRSITQVVGA